MTRQLEEIQAQALGQIESAESLDSLEQVRVRVLGRKGTLTQVLRSLGELPAEERPALGQAANEVKQILMSAIESRKARLEEEAARRREAVQVDLSLPGRRPPKGRLHPLSQLMGEIVEIFSALGFQVASGPDIETEYYNFDSLNTPADHPARDLHDTFFVKPGVVLRTHTSPVQMRVMEVMRPPVAVIVPGRVYRRDADPTHSPMFFQVEGLLVDKGVTMADLKGTVFWFVRRLFGSGVEVRFRPHYFPFTEPSAEVDIAWSAGAKKDWLEIMGCGMVHPEVFRYAQYDYEEYAGYAFGMGVDRIAMVRHGIDAIYHFYENDLRFLEQF